MFTHTHTHKSSSRK